MSRPPPRQPPCARGSPRTAPCTDQRWGDGEGHQISCSLLRRVGEEGTGRERSRRRSALTSSSTTEGRDREGGRRGGRALGLGGGGDQSTTKGTRREPGRVGG
jgi:hypothetical protein